LGSSDGDGTFAVPENAAAKHLHAEVEGSSMGQPTPFIGRLPLWCVLAAAAAVLPSCATLKAGANAGFSSPGVGYKLVTLGDVYACALRVDGGLACWGSDLNHDATSPPAGRFVHVDAGATCACAVRDNGTLACWGLSQQGACNPPPGNQYTRVSVGKYFSCAVLRDGTAQCWGGAKFFAAAASGTIVDVEATTEHVCFVTSAAWADTRPGASARRL
jgi:hypothetical protein